jgi:hypothetical protein
MDAERAEIGAGGDLLAAGIGMRFDLFDDLGRQLVSHSVSSLSFPDAD